MPSRTVEIKNKLGLHTRAAAKLVAKASEYQCACKINFNDQQADAKSIMAVMMLAASQGCRIHISTTGSDAEDALQALVELIDDYFGEGE